MIKRPLIILLSIIVLGFIIAAFLPVIGPVCSEMRCLCDADGEKLCNACSTVRPIFELGILNAAKVCVTHEIITCSNGTEINKRNDSNENCKFRYYYLGKELNSEEKVNTPG